MGRVLLNNIGGFPIARLPRVVEAVLWWVSRKCGGSLMLEETACLRALRGP